MAKAKKDAAYLNVYIEKSTVERLTLFWTKYLTY